MSVKIHIDRLVIDAAALSRSEAPLFQAALASELTLLRHPPREPIAAPANAVTRLARRTAAAIHDRMPTARRPGS